MFDIPNSFFVILFLAVLCLWLLRKIPRYKPPRTEGLVVRLYSKGKMVSCTEGVGNYIYIGSNHVRFYQCVVHVRLKEKTEIDRVTLALLLFPDLEAEMEGDTAPFVVKEGGGYLTFLPQDGRTSILDIRH